MTQYAAHLILKMAGADLLAHVEATHVVLDRVATRLDTPVSKDCMMMGTTREPAADRRFVR